MYSVQSVRPCSLGLLSANARQPGRIDPLGHIFLEVMAPFQRLTAGVAGLTRGNTARPAAAKGRPVSRARAACMAAEAPSLFEDEGQA